MVSAKLLTVDVRVRANAVRIGSAGIVVVLGIAVDRPLTVLLAITVGWIGEVVAIRPSPVRAAFNLPNFLVAAGLAEVTYRAIAGSNGVDQRTWAALAAACVAYFVVNFLLVTTAITLTSGMMPTRRLFSSLVMGSLAAAADMVLLVVAVSTMRVAVWGLAIVATIVVGTFLLLRRQQDLSDKYGNLELLYGFTDRLAGLTDATDVLTTALRTVADLLNCAEVELISRRGGTFERMAVHPNGALVQSADYEPLPFERAVITSGEPLLLPRGHRPPDVAADLAERGWRDAVLVPVRGTATIDGVLIAADRLGDTSTFTISDQRLLETLAAHSSVALRGSELLDRLRDEVKARSYEALHDSLTGLANRKLFRQRLDASLDRSGSKPVAVLMLDIDNFKEINDTLGHHTGDDILREVADRLRQAVGEAGIACRIGGDEFAVILPNPMSPEAAVAVAERARATLAEPLFADTMTFSLQTAVGVAVAPEDGGDSGSLLRRADVAMYAAKADKTGVERYDPARDPNTTRRLRLTSDLRKAIEEGEIQLWYQPKAELGTGRIVGVEALARWTHERYGAIPPDEFVPIAEQSGSIGPLTAAVLAKAIRQKRDWERIGLHLDVAVNISARNLLDTELVSRLQRLIASYSVDPSGIIIELTESSVMSDAERAEKMLGELSKIGVRIAVDDFGTGYSSLSRLSRLPVSEIKVDKSFVTNMLASNTEPIVTATIELAASLGQQVTAEGVEDRATWERLKELGCDFVQGYFLARPMEAEIATTWLVDAGGRRSMLRPA